MIRGRNPRPKRITWSPHAWSVPHPVESCSLLWRNSTSIFFSSAALSYKKFIQPHFREVFIRVFCMPHDWLKNLAPLFYPIRSKTKTNHDSLANVLPRFASVTCNYLEFWLVHWIACDVFALNILKHCLVWQPSRLRNPLPPEKNLAFGLYRLGHGNSCVSIGPQKSQVCSWWKTVD